MKRTQVKARWALAAVLGVFPVTGLICAVAYHDISMFYWSLATAAMAAVVFPVVIFIVHVLGSYVATAFVGLLLGIQRLFTRK